jgi:hypothetical protein
MEIHVAAIKEKPHILSCGKQRTLMDGYQISFNSWLAYLCCHPPTTHELETPPNIIVTADVDCNSSIFDYLAITSMTLRHFMMPLTISLIMQPFDQYRASRYWAVAIQNTNVSQAALTEHDMIDGKLWQPDNVCATNGVKMASFTNRQPGLNYYVICLEGHRQKRWNAPFCDYTGARGHV